MRSKSEIEKIISDAESLKDIHDFDKALRLLSQIESAIDLNTLREFLHLKAECIYQNREIPTYKRFKKALKVLNELEEDDETKRLKGAIYKRKFYANRSLDDLYRSIYYYESVSNDPSNDLGYGAVNTIFLYYTLMDHLKTSWSKRELQACQLKVRRLGTKTLKYILDAYPTVADRREKDIWLEPTVAELRLGLYRFVEFTGSIQNSFEDDPSTPISRKEYTTMEQLIRLYDLLPDHKSKEQFSLSKLFESAFHNKNDLNIEVITRSVRMGKVGLALSGGGFRASLFHIGVFHRLAELDILRHIEIISSVSGGSIIAMHYYLKLRLLLEENDNDSLGRPDYIRLVQELEKEFIDGIQTNIRMQAFSGRSYDITKRLGELYQEQLFNRTSPNVPILMKQLKIFPQIGKKIKKDFHPHHHNYELKNKVPILIINATNFNNGHNWKFTAKGMGESPYMYDTTVDKNSVMLYSAYDDFSPEYQDITIGTAVAASSAVPVLFDPVDMGDPFHQKDTTIRLVDGGVYDNQGLASVINEECDIIITSDASKHLKEEGSPSNFRLDVDSRLTNVLMNKTRDSEFKIAKELRRSDKIKGLSILHLKQCFEQEMITPLKKDEGPVESHCKTKSLYPPLDKEVQTHLTNIRTDLDAFHDVEAQALIQSGYEITSHWFETYGMEQDAWKEFDREAPKERKSPELDQRLSDVKERARMLELLHLSGRQMMKTLLVAKICGSIGILVLGGVFEYLFFEYGFYEGIVKPIFSIVGPVLTVSLLLFVTNSKMFMKKLWDGALFTILKPVSWGYLRLCNAIYLEKGKL